MIAIIIKVIIRLVIMRPTSYFKYMYFFCLSFCYLSLHILLTLFCLFSLHKLTQLVLLCDNCVYFSIINYYNNNTKNNNNNYCYFYY